MQEQAIDIITYGTQHFDPFWYRRPILNQIQTPGFIQPQDGV
jgi:hypothetical protein